MWIYHILYVHLSVSGHLGYFYLLTVTNNAALNTCVQVWCGNIFPLMLGIYLEVGLMGHIVALVFNSLRIYQTVFQSSCTILHTHQQCTRVLIFPHPLQHWLFSLLLIIAILLGVKCYFIVVLICILLLPNAIEHYFMCF